MRRSKENEEMVGGVNGNREQQNEEAGRRKSR
jgi:hypothetical protein